ncbi:M67 family metallopeptidase [Halobacteria archaeon AArc-m2/3/4]|uniref:M67 family metallopeptidase n=1 Tax=Natronoglomus mannanivorans TaxID=2979990 RepID=A0ABT2QHG5_9EURY|nr:M67 family metallopeptidase [Halobacteria archaeon AArc-m2/3/4]
MIVCPDPIRETLLEDARAGAPAEVCGVLGGEFGRERSRIRSHYPAENVASDPQIRYQIAPREQLELFERLEDRGEEIVGFVHSHPEGPATPSATDVADATWPDRSYVIVSLPGDDVTSWRWRSGRDEFEREACEVSSGSGVQTR